MCRRKDGVEDGDDEDDNEDDDDESWTAGGVSGDDGWVGRGRRGCRREVETRERR